MIFYQIENMLDKGNYWIPTQVSSKMIIIYMLKKSMEMLPIRRQKFLSAHPVFRYAYPQISYGRVNVFLTGLFVLKYKIAPNQK
jgi:hypothetical protein